MTREIWLFGDSYAREHPECDYSWPILLKQQYNTKNFAVGGSGPDYQLSVFLDNLSCTPDTSNIDVIFFVSDIVRFNFKFLHCPSHQYVLKHLDNTNTKVEHIGKYKKYKKFVKSFFQDYIYHSTYKETETIKIILLLKELSKHFSNMIIIPIFDNLDEPYVSFDSTKELCIIKNKFRDIESDEFMSNPNHMSRLVHAHVYERLSHWLDTHENICFKRTNNDLF